MAERILIGGVNILGSSGFIVVIGTRITTRSIESSCPLFRNVEGNYFSVTGVSQTSPRTWMAPVLACAGGLCWWPLCWCAPVLVLCCLCAFAETRSVGSLLRGYLS